MAADGASQHRHAGGSSIPIVEVDCFFITSEGVKKRKELEFEENSSGEALLDPARARGEIIKCLLARCFESKNVFALLTVNLFLHLLLPEKRHAPRSSPAQATGTRCTV